nr:12340_t:CDS:2 [Entrophospora candida]
MNYNESLVRLNLAKTALKKTLEDESASGPFSVTRELLKRKLDLVEAVIGGYSQSFAQEISDDKIERAFSELYGFTKQKQKLKDLLLLQEIGKAENIDVSEGGKALCFVGPPGVGKTHFAQKFAEATGRKFFGIDLGGASSSVEKPGKDPHHGAIEDALLKVLDSNRNRNFRDQFLNVEIDISRITFICTANKLGKISEPLKNRLEIIELKGYSKSEKIEIGKLTIEKIFRKKFKNKNRNLFEMTEGGLRALVSKTNEEGARQLESKIEDERADITPDLAARLALYFNSTVEFWLNLQRSYKEEVAKERTELLKEEIVPYKEKREQEKQFSTNLLDENNLFSKVFKEYGESGGRPGEKKSYPKGTFEEISDYIEKDINGLLISEGKRFPDLTNLKELNEWVNNLTEINERGSLLLHDR